MEHLLQWMEIIEDNRQQSKVRHSLKDILAIVLFAALANANTWEEIADGRHQMAFPEEKLERQKKVTVQPGTNHSADWCQENR